MALWHQCDDLGLRHHCQAIPPFPENTHQAPRLAHLDIARFVHRVAQKEIAGKHGDAEEMSTPTASGPHIDLRQKQVKALRR
jgi:hypothetical protein